MERPALCCFLLLGPLLIQTVAVRGTRRPLPLETRAGQALDPAAITRDVRRLWTTGWFDDVRVESTGDAPTTQVIFTVVEKPRLYLRKVLLEPAGQRRPAGLEAGTPIDAARARQAAEAIRRQLIEEGYSDAKVEAKLVPAGFRQVDLRLDVERGPRYRVAAVRFSGDLAMEPERLRRALRATRVRWWWPRPAFTERGVEADLDRLRSLYFSLGYLDAQVRLAGIDFSGRKATVRVAVEAGRRYEVQPRPPDVCRCLLEAERQAEKEGAIDFAARLIVDRGEAANTAELSAIVEKGPVYRVGRIEFRGHHYFGDGTLRRALAFDEGDVFDPSRLRRSLARLSRTGAFEPLAEDDVRLARDPLAHRVNVTLSLREKPRGRWSLSGPLAPLSVAGPLQFAIQSRLPAWATYYATFSLVGFSSPWLRALPFGGHLTPLAGIARPYWPGEGWRSGFLLSPQLGLKGTLANYGTTHLYEAARVALSSGSGSPTLPVPVVRSAGNRPAGYLLCEDSRPLWRRLF